MDGIVSMVWLGLYVWYSWDCKAYVAQSAA